MRGNLLAKAILFFHCPIIIWFGYFESVLVIERAYYVVLAAISIVLFMRGQARLVAVGPLAIIMLWMFWASLGLLHATDPSLVLQRLVTVSIRLVSTYLVLTIAAGVYNGYRIIGHSLLLSSVVAGALCIVSPATFSEAGRYFGTVANANAFGVQLSAGLIAALFILNIHRKVLSLLVAVPSVLFIMFLMVGTGSRKAMLGMMLILVLYGLILAVAKGGFSARRLLAGLLTSVVMISIGSAWIMHSEHADRVTRIYDAYALGKTDEARESEINRLRMYEAGVKAAKENPILGIGLDNFRVYDIDRFGTSFGTYAHSNYIELMSGTGYVGLMIYLAFVLMVVLSILRNRSLSRQEIALFCMIVAVILVYDFASVSYYDKTSWCIYLWILAAAANKPMRSVRRLAPDAALTRRQSRVA